MDREALWAMIRGDTKSQTQLTDLTLSHPPGNDQTAELPCSSLYLPQPPAEPLCVLHYLNENDAKEQEGQAYLFLPRV